MTRKYWSGADTFFHFYLTDVYDKVTAPFTSMADLSGKLPLRVDTSPHPDGGSTFAGAPGSPATPSTPATPPTSRRMSTPVDRGVIGQTGDDKDIRMDVDHTGTENGDSPSDDGKERLLSSDEGHWPNEVSCQFVVFSRDDRFSIGESSISRSTVHFAKMGRFLATAGHQRVERVGLVAINTFGVHTAPRIFLPLGINT